MPHIAPRPMDRRRPVLPLFVLVAAILAGCGGGSGSGGAVTPPPPSVTAPVVQIMLTEQSEPNSPVKFSPAVTNPANLQLQYAWNFGDGKTSTSERPEHAYAATGNYVVTLAVTSSAGTSNSTSPIQVGYFTGIAGLDCTGAKNAQGWCRQSYLPTSQDLNSVKMTSKTVVWALGQKNTILRSTDGGNSWISKHVSTTAKLTAITAADANTAWVVGTGGFESHTRDGGATWSSGRMPSSALDLQAITVARDATTLWATGDSGAIVKSSDGGATWSDQSLGRDKYICLLWSVSAVDATSAWAAGPACIARTTDGGQTWVTSDGFNVKSITAVDADTAWLAKSFSIEKTTDGGKNWTAQLSTSLSGTGVGPQYTSISAVDANTVFAVDYSGFIVKTGDGGKTWSDQSPPEAFVCCQGPRFNTVSAFDATSAVAVGSGGAVFASSDGLNWLSKNKGTFAGAGGDIRSIAVFDAQHAAVFVDGYGLAYYTVNGGSTWLRQESPKSIDCAHTITKVNATTAVGLGCAGGLFKSVDQGKNWQVSYFSSHYLNALSVAGENVIWAAGEYGTIQRSIDAGATWNVVSGAVPNVAFHAIYALDENNAWAAGDSETMLRTTDGGKSWTTQTVSSSHGGYLSIIALNANVAWATHSSKSILSTTDGGTNWRKVETGVEEIMRSLATLDGKVLWAAGMNGKILRSEDGGKTWAVQPSGTTSNLVAIRLIDNNTAWVTGEDGSILKTATGGK